MPGLGIGISPVFVGFAGNGLSISAPSAVLFADGDQPIELWDYEAHNLLPYSADLTNWTISTGAASATTLQDENASAVVPAQQLAPQVEGRTYRISVRVDQDAVASSTRFAAIGWYQQSGVASAFVFDTSDADNNYGLLTDRPQPISYSITDVGPGTYWDIEIVFESEFTTSSGGVILYGAFGAQIDLYNSGAFRTAAAYVAASATTGGGTNLVGIVRSQFADASSPTSYVATTGTASTLTASYGDIQFADSQYDSGADSYKINLDIADGDMTLQTVSGLTFTPTTGGDGTADASMEFTGTLANCLVALRGISVDNVAVGTVDLDVLITHVASGRAASKTISVTAFDPNASVTPGQAALSYTGFAPVAYSAIAVEAGQSALTYTGYAPAVSTGDTPSLIQDVTVEADGWTLSVTTDGVTGGTFSHGTPSAPNFALTVQSKSWTTGGVETTKERTVFILGTKRKPYPNQNDRDETDNTGTVTTKFSLNDYIYADDTITAITVADGWFTDDGSGGSSDANTAGNAVSLLTDNSSIDYPKPAIGWLEEQLQWVQAGSFSPKLAVFHKYGENANQVRAVKFIATDGSNTVEVFATSMSSTTGSVSGLTYSYYTASISLTSLDAEAMITVDATIYPWVGDSYTISTDCATYPNQICCPLRFLNDKNSSYGAIYAYVDATSGNNGTGVASPSPATAEASPFQTISAAAAAALTLNNSTNSRNNTSGCIVRLEADTYTSLGDDNMDTLASGDVPLIIAAANPANKATTVISRSDTTNNDLPDLVRFEDLTFTTGGGIPFDGGSTVEFSNQYFLIRCTMASTAGSTTGLIYRGDLITLISCDANTAHNGSEPIYFSTTVHRPVLMLDCDWTTTNSAVWNFQTFVGNRVVKSGGPLGVNNPHTNSSTVTIKKMAVQAFNYISCSDTRPFSMEGNASGIDALAFCGNIIESFDNVPDPTSLFENNGSSVANLILHHNTVIGHRFNVCYTTSGNSIDFENISIRGSLFWRLNMKSDIFDTDGTKDQNWALRHRVGCSYLATTHGDSNSGDTATPAPASWIGELVAPGEEFQVDPDYVDDNSTSTGAGGGSGDYQPDASNTLPTIPAALVPWPKDIGGNTYAQDGTDLIGAYCVAA